MKHRFFIFLFLLLGFLSCDQSSQSISEQDKKIKQIYEKLSNRRSLSKDTVRNNIKKLEYLNASHKDFKAIKEIILGNYHWRYASLDSAQIHYNNVLSFNSISDTLKGFAQVGLGNVYKDLGENTKALTFYQNALLPFENKNKNSAHIYKNIGAIYMSLERFDESLDYYQKAENTALKYNDSLLYADCQNNIGTVLEQQNKLDESIVKYQTALGIYQRHNVLDGISYAYSNLAIVHKLKKEYQTAAEYNLKSLELAQKVDDKWMQAAILNNIANLYREMRDFEKAKNYANQSLELSNAISAPEIVYNTYETLMFIAFEENNSAEAKKYQELFTKTKDSFENTEVNRQLSELNIKYETEKKEKILAKQEIELNKKNIFLLILSGLVLIILLLLRNYTVKSRLKQKQLILENKLLEEQTHSKIQEQRLNISRELHDRVGSQLTFIISILDGLKNKKIPDETVNQKINSLTEFAHTSVDELQDTIWVLNANTLTLEELKMKMLNFINNADEATDNLKFDFDFQITQNLELSSLQTVNIYRAFQEIINNSIKYSKGSEITVRAKQNKNLLFLHLSDNGIGFDFEANKSKSFGLTNIQNRIIELGGRLEVNSEKGTNYRIEIPLF